MLITTEIRNKTILDFPTPLPAEKIKHYQEHFALAVLRYLKPAVYDRFRKQDAPDLQSIDKKHGVEVTFATSSEEASIDGNYAKLRLTQDETYRQRLELKIKRNGGRIDDYGISYPVKDMQREDRVIREAIEKKNRKLDAYKAAGFESMSLFIYYEEPLFPRSEEQIKTLLDGTRGSQTYDSIYLCAPHCLISYQFSSRDLQIISIPREDYEALVIIARMTVDGMIDIDNPVWTSCKE